MTQRHHLLRLILAVLVAMTQIGVAIACGDACSQALKSAAHTAESCCGMKCHEPGKECKCPSVASDDSLAKSASVDLPAPVSLVLGVPLSQPAIAVGALRPVTRVAFPHLEEVPLGLPPPSDLHGRAPPVA